MSAAQIAVASSRPVNAKALLQYLVLTHPEVIELHVTTHALALQPELRELSEASDVLGNWFRWLDIDMTLSFYVTALSESHFLFRDSYYTTSDADDVTW